MTKTPSAGDELLARIRERRLAISTGRAMGVRLTQAGGYVGVKLRPPPPLEQFPVGKGWLELFAAGQRKAGAMAMEACRLAGRKITSQDKANRAVKADLRALGKERWWLIAKVKSGRPPAQRA